jgi:hypothetical protein
MVAASLMMLGACAAEDDNAALMRLVADAAAAAEARDTGFFRGLISERYSDARGNDRDRVIGMIRGYFLSHESVEVVTRVNAIALRGTDAAEMAVLAGILGQRAGARLLGGLDGRLYRLDLEFVREGGDWRIIGAQWERSLETWDENQ